MDRKALSDIARKKRVFAYADKIARGTLKLKRLSDFENRKPSFDYSPQTAK